MNKVRSGCIVSTGYFVRPTTLSSFSFLPSFTSKNGLLVGTLASPRYYTTTVLPTEATVARYTTHGQPEQVLK